MAAAAQSSGFAQWMIDQGKKPDTVQRYLNLLTNPESSESPLEAAVDCGLCRKGDSLLDLSSAQLYQLSTQNIDKRKATPAVGALLNYKVEQELSRLGQPDKDAIFSFFSVLKDLYNALPKKDVPDFRFVVLQALLLEPGLLEKQFQLVRDVRPDGKKYPLHRVVALENLDSHYQEVVEALEKKLSAFPDRAEVSNRPCYGLRSWLSSAAEKLNRQFNGLDGFEGSGIHQLLRQMEGWKPNFSVSHKQDDGDWYSPLRTGGMLHHIADLLCRLFQQTLLWEGREGFPPAVCPSGLTQEDQLYSALLAPFDRLLTAGGQLSKVSKLPFDTVAHLLELGLFRVEAVPYQGTSRLVSNRLLSQTAKAPITAAGIGAYSSVELVWMTLETRQLLCQLLRCLKQEQERTDLKPTEQARLLDDTLFELAPELLKLLAVAPVSADEPSAGMASPGDVGKTLLELSTMPGISLGGSDLEALKRKAAALCADSETAEATGLLISILVRCHWNICQKGVSPKGVDSLWRIINLYRQRPQAVSQVFSEILDDKGGSKAKKGDLKRRLQVDSCGESLFLAQLYSRCAEASITLAMDENQAQDQREFWVNSAHNAGTQAAQIARRQGQFLWALDFTLLRAKALALHAAISAQPRHMTAAELLTDLITPCAQALLQCQLWLRRELPEQKASVEANGGRFPDELISQRGQALHETARFCAAQLFEEASPVLSILKGHKDLWAAIPHTCITLDDQRALSDVRLYTPADSNLKDRSGLLCLPDLWLPTDRYARFFLPWFCSYLDSETAKRKHYQPGFIETYLLMVLLSLQNVLLTANQAVDNAVIRSLAYNSGFQQMLRTGHVTISFFGSFYSLQSYAANRMAKSDFEWSSLPVELNGDMEARTAAARYLRDECSEADLPNRFRSLLIRFKDSLRLLDENLPARCKADHYQYPRKNHPPITLAGLLNQFYYLRRDQESFRDMRYLHTLLLRPSLDPAVSSGFSRSLYKSALDALKEGKLDQLNQLQEYCAPELLQSNTPARNFAASLAVDRDKLEMLSVMQSILSDAYNRQLGGLCSDYQHHLYSQEERLKGLIPYDESTPILGSCRTFQDTISLTETGTRIDWDHAADIITRAEALAREAPNASPDALAGKLTGSVLDYTVSEGGDMLRTSRATLYTSTHQQFLVETSKDIGTVHLETEEG